MKPDWPLTKVDPGATVPSSVNDTGKVRKAPVATLLGSEKVQRSAKLTSAAACAPKSVPGLEVAASPIDGMPALAYMFTEADSPRQLVLALKTKISCTVSRGTNLA